MCTEHTTECSVCGKEYMVYVAFCQDYRPPILHCPRGIDVVVAEMVVGKCPSPVCPNSRTGGCQVI